MLGPVEVRLDGRPVDLGTPKQRALRRGARALAGRPVPVDTIVDLLWGDDPARRRGRTLQAYVAGLRRVLEPGRTRRGAGDGAGHRGSGLRAAPSPTTAWTPGGSSDGRPVPVTAARVPGLGPPPLSGAELRARSSRGLDEALALWRGEPYAELEDAPAAVAERARLEELRLVALEDRAVARARARRHHPRPRPSWRR